MKTVKTIIITGLALAAAFTAGCGKQGSIAVEERCGDCVGGECKLPGALASAPQTESALPAARGAQTTPANANGSQGLIKTVYRKIPMTGGKQDAATPVVAKIKPAKLEDAKAMAGTEGHFNDVKLPGIAHEDQPEEQPFLVRTFNKNVWPGGMPLEAEVDPEITNY